MGRNREKGLADKRAMGRIEMFAHVVWATWQRRPLVDESVERRLHGAIAAKCRRMGCDVLAVGSTADHVHLLVHLHPSMPLARLVGEAKGYSSFLMTHQLTPHRFFRWQEQYAARSIAPEGLPTVLRYIHPQRDHHPSPRLLR